MLVKMRGRGKLKKERNKRESQARVGKKENEKHIHNTRSMTKNIWLIDMVAVIKKRMNRLVKSVNLSRKKG